MDERSFTAADKLKAIDRELGYRRRVYGRRVADGKMTQSLADEQIAVFEAIRDDYQKIAAQERLVAASWQREQAAPSPAPEQRAETLRRAVHALGDAPHAPEGLSHEERLVWLLGDLMNAAENYFGAQNAKREGHIYCAAARIIDEVLMPALSALSALPHPAPAAGYARATEACACFLCGKPNCCDHLPHRPVRPPPRRDSRRGGGREAIEGRAALTADKEESR